MKTIEGIYTSAVIFNTDTKKYSIDDYAVAQLQALCDNKAFAGCKVRVMPDVHPGKVGTIGFTSTLGRRVLPNVIGIDIGCGITIANIKGKTRELQKLDTVIREHIPCGFDIRKKPYHHALEFDFTSLRCYKHINEEKALLCLGTLGGGNHFIELDVFEQDGESETYFVVLTGSRHLGKEVTEYYLKEGQKVLKASGVRIPYELTYLEGNLMENYLHDMVVVQEFAEFNREIILAETAKFMKWKVLESAGKSQGFSERRTDPADHRWMGR